MILIGAVEWSGDRGRGRAARDAAEPRADRRLRRAVAAQERRPAGRAGARSPRFPAPVPRHRAERRDTAASLRGRPRPLARRTLVGRSTTAPRDRPAPATRSENRLAISRAFPETSSAACTCSGLAGFFCGACARASPPARRAPMRSAGRAGAAPRAGRRDLDAPPLIVLLTPGPVQRDLQRAGVPRALPRLPAGDGRRPDRAPRLRVAEDAVGPAAGVRRSCAGSTTTSATRSSCAGDSALGVPGPDRRRCAAATS